MTLILFSINSSQAWEISSEFSRIEFISIKQANFIELYQFNHFQGRLNKEGDLELTIDLNSVNTGSPIRNRYIRQYFFQTNRYKVINATILFDQNMLDSIENNQSRSILTQVKIDLHNVEKNLPIELIIIKENDEEIIIQTENPFIIDLRDFNYIEALMHFKKHFSLQAINAVVPVIVSFRLKHAV